MKQDTSIIKISRNCNHNIGILLFAKTAKKLKYFISRYNILSDLIISICSISGMICNIYFGNIYLSFKVWFPNQGTLVALWEIFFCRFWQQNSTYFAEFLNLLEKRLGGCQSIDKNQWKILWDISLSNNTSKQLLRLLKVFNFFLYS